ncbi:MAG TPA: carbohydrate ABC transporter permease, partial [Clostridiales bacterium]|nr:carbohydrate ABC transporter permease [Clostridiales bacterium]
MKDNNSAFEIVNGKFHINFKWVFVYTIMLALVAFTALPLIYLVSTAFKPYEELFLFPPRFFVRRPTLKNFGDLVISLSGTTVPFTRYIFNSLFVTVVNVTLTILVSSMGAYAISKHNIPGSGIVFGIVIAALTFPAQVTQIPTYMTVSSLGLLNTYWALIITHIAVPYNFFLMKQFIDQFPNELLESSRMDGANEWKTFWKIVMPAVKPAWATLLVFSFTSNWNDSSTALIYTNKQAMKVLPLALQTIAGGAAASSLARAGASAAASFLMTAPTIIIFV